MAHVSPVFLFITLFQVCRLTLSATETWYSANVINNGDFSPKPISEIFSSTEAPPPFSTKNPIVVLSPSPSPQRVSTASISTYNPNGINSFTTSTPLPEQFLSTSPSVPTGSNFFETQSTFSLPTQPDRAEFSPFPFQIIEQPNGLPVLQEKEKPQEPPNYFVVYQQPPRILESYPSGPQQGFASPQTTLSTLQPEISTPQSTFSTFRPEISSTESIFSSVNNELSFSQFPTSTMRPEISTMSSTFSTLIPVTNGFAVSGSPDFTSSGTTFSTAQPSQTTFTSTPRSTSSLSTLPSTSGPSTLWSAISTVSTLRPPCSNGTGTLPFGFNYPSLRIRMVAPKGSITNIHLNPLATPSPRRTKTTRKPTTARTRKTKITRNNYDMCLNSCSGKKAPICAAPLAKIPIDPNTLKGFPSICHMACFNSFKKIQYEMLVDGRCGRLRNRIRPLDSNTKLKKTELDKAQYTIVNDPQTIVEVSNLSR
ncbi:flocculation protein FLO11-like [Hyposmocoma kahamanoa]|uniref:flocculation protein FLO11-like n=1 Tax=Hyposmocoma kahamanoa TaxID=1477025 RepID=UPI000E6D7A57|nr:flocculation protein FLO11-like [Hyposmocoma kahamanoa]